MKLILTADNHIRSTAPINRKDNYTAAQLRKLVQMVEACNRMGARILCAGDFLDKPTVPYWLLNEVVRSLRGLGREFFVIPGNHCLRGGALHTLIETSIYTLGETGCIDLLLTQEAVYLGNDGREVWLHPLPYGVDNPSNPVAGGYNILLSHIPVFESAIPFYMEGCAHTANSIKKLYPGFDLYVCGDIHEPFYRDKVLVTGSMMRMTIAQRDFKPRFYVLDTIEDTVEPVFFNIEEDVWRDVTEQVADEEYKEALTELADAMRERDERLDYPTVCRSLAADNPKYEGMIQTLINEHGGKV